MKAFILFSLFLCAPLLGVNFCDFDVYQGLFTKEEVSNKIQNFLEKDSQIGAFYQLTDDAFYIGNLAEQKIDFTLHLANACSLDKKNRWSHKGLKGAKIAIDPGHFGGMYAELEQRCLKIASQEIGASEPLMIAEGSLTYLTALELKALLEEAGASVMITRDGIGKGACEQSFFSWLNENPQFWTSRDSLSTLFRNYYNREDLKLRAQKINSFQPDITLILHYNGSLGSQEKEKKTLLTEANYSLAFIPGSFCKGELSTAEDRYEFLRLMLTGVVEESLQLSRYVVTQFLSCLDVPLISDDQASGIASVCLKQNEGIYARNLALTRLVNSPLCYGEPLIQNNREEIGRLSKNDSEIAQIPCPKRIKDVAQAYFEGIKAYFNTHHIQ